MEVSLIPAAIAGITNALALSKEIAITGHELEKSELKLKVADINSALADAKIALAESKTRIHELEGELKVARSGEKCPLCTNGQLKVTDVKPHKQLGQIGVQMRKLVCDNQDCTHHEERLFDPNNQLGK